MKVNPPTKITHISARICTCTYLFMVLLLVHVHMYLTLLPDNASTCIVGMCRSDHLNFKCIINYKWGEGACFARPLLVCDHCAC